MFYELLVIFILSACIRGIKTIQKLVEVRGHRGVTALLIGIDSIIFLLVFKRIITSESTIPFVLALSSGYITGYLMGAMLEEKMALGKVMVTLKIAKEDSKELAQRLQEKGFIFSRSKRVYSHKNKLRKIYQGVIYRKELPTLKRITADLNMLGIIENIKETFGKEVRSAKEYLAFNRRTDLRRKRMPRM